MNPLLAESISRYQLIKRRDNTLPEITKEDAARIKEQVDRIASFKLGRTGSEDGERTGWFECDNQELLVKKLQPSNDQKQFLGAITLSLRVMKLPEEGPTARVLELVGFPTSEVDLPTKHLFRVLALGAEDTQHGVNMLLAGGYAIVPGTPEFEDICTIVDSFSPQQ